MQQTSVQYGKLTGLRRLMFGEKQEGHNEKLYSNLNRGCADLVAFANDISRKEGKGRPSTECHMRHCEDRNNNSFKPNNTKT